MKKPEAFAHNSMHHQHQVASSTLHPDHGARPVHHQSHHHQSQHSLGNTSMPGSSNHGHLSIGGSNQDGPKLNHQKQLASLKLGPVPALSGGSSNGHPEVVESPISYFYYQANNGISNPSTNQHHSNLLPDGSSMDFLQSPNGELPLAVETAGGILAASSNITHAPPSHTHQRDGRMVPILQTSQITRNNGVQSKQQNTSINSRGNQDTYQPNSSDHIHKQYIEKNSGSQSVTKAGAHQSQAHHLTVSRSAMGQLTNNPSVAGNGTPATKKNGFIKPPIANMLVPSKSSMNANFPTSGHNNYISPHHQKLHHANGSHYEEEHREPLDQQNVEEEDDRGVRISNGRNDKKRRNIFGEHSVDKAKNKSPYSISVKALPKFRQQGPTSSDSKSKKPSIAINSTGTSELHTQDATMAGSLTRSTYNPLAQVNSSSQQRQLQLTRVLPNQNEGSEPAIIHRGQKKSSTNVVGDQKPHLPPLDPKAPNENSIKKRFLQKGMVASAEMNFIVPTSMLDQTGVLSEAHSAAVGHLAGYQQRQNINHYMEQTASEQTHQLLSQDEALPEGPSHGTSYANETRYSRVSQYQHHHALGGGLSNIIEEQKLAKTDIKPKPQKGAQMLHQSPPPLMTNSPFTTVAPELPCFNPSTSLKKNLQQAHKKYSSNHQMKVTESLHAQKKHPEVIMNPQQLHETSPISRNLQFNNVYQSQTLLAANDHNRVSPQVRPQESHSHIRGYKLRYQANQAQHALRQSKSKPAFQPANLGTLEALNQHNQSIDGAGQTLTEKKNIMRANLHLNMKTVHDYQNASKQYADHALQGFSDTSYNMNGLGGLASGGEKASSNDRNQRGSLYAGGYTGLNHKESNNELVMFSGSGINGRFGPIGTDGLVGVEPDSFSERCSSINDDRACLEPNEFDDAIFKIGRGGLGDSEEDVRLYKDIEIRLKLEPLSLQLLHGFNDRIRSHLHGQGKPALGNLLGLLYQQFSKLYNKSHHYGGGENQSRTQLNIIKQLQAKNVEQNQLIQVLQSEVQALTMTSALNGSDPEDQRSKYKLLISKNQELIVELEMLKDRLAVYESCSEREGMSLNQLHAKETSVESISPANLIVLNDQRQGQTDFAKANQQARLSKTKKAPLPVPKLNLEKALQLNMKIYNSQPVEMTKFQAPMESSDRGSYMGFKLHQNFQQIGGGPNAEEEVGIPIPATVMNQPLVRPTTTMGGRKKVKVIKKLTVTTNPNQIQEVNEQESTNRGGADDDADADIEVSSPREAKQLDSFDRIKPRNHSKPHHGGSKKPPQGKTFQEKMSSNDINERDEESLDDAERVELFRKEQKAAVKKLTGKAKGFHEEFMDKYDEFSLSWRAAIDREKRF